MKERTIAGGIEVVVVVGGGWFVLWLVMGLEV